MADNLPIPGPSASLDSAALERVIARASELASRAGEAPESLTEAQLIDLGKEVGIPAQYLREALAEERTRVIVPEEATGLSRFFGPTRLTASRTIVGRPDRVLPALDRWMQREECMRVKRQYGDRMTWDARRDLVGNIKRGFNIGGRGYALSRTEEVGATVTAVDESRVLVRLDADIGAMRRESTGWSTFGTVFGLGGAGAVIALAVLTGGSLPLAVGIAGGAGVAGGAIATGVARAQRRFAERVQLALDQVLDHLQRGDAPVDSVLSVLNAATRSLR